MQNRYAGPCIHCGETVEPGKGRTWRPRGRGRRRWLVRHTTCRGQGPAPDPENIQAYRERARDDAEYARGVADVERWRANRQLFGDAYADAEELAWELRDPDPAY